MVLVAGPSEDGQGAKVLRVRDDRIETGELRGVRDGMPIVGELVKLTPRAEHARAFDVEVLARGHQPEAESDRKGPAKGNSRTFRANWESIFGRGDSAGGRDPGSGPN